MSSPLSIPVESSIALLLERSLEQKDRHVDSLKSIPDGVLGFAELGRPVSSGVSSIVGRTLVLSKCFECQKTVTKEPFCTRKAVNAKFVAFVTNVFEHFLERRLD